MSTCLWDFCHEKCRDKQVYFYASNWTTYHLFYSVICHRQCPKSRYFIFLRMDPCCTGLIMAYFTSYDSTKNLVGLVIGNLDLQAKAFCANLIWSFFCFFLSQDQSMWILLITHKDLKKTSPLVHGQLRPSTHLLWKNMQKEKDLEQSNQGGRSWS